METSIPDSQRNCFTHGTLFRSIDAHLDRLHFHQRHRQFVLPVEFRNTRNWRRRSEVVSGPVLDLHSDKEFDFSFHFGIHSSHSPTSSKKNPTFDLI